MEIINMDEQYKDWHKADILAAVRKVGLSMAALSRRHGLSDSTLSNALVRSWPRGERIIADAIGKEPWVIWPSRYHDPVTHAFIDRGASMRKPIKKTV